VEEQPPTFILNGGEQFHILSKQVILYLEHAFGSLHRVEVYIVSDVSAVHTASNLKIGVRGVDECFLHLYIFGVTSAQPTRFDPEDGRIMYLRNVGDTADFHT
jgi:hypothetical protein